MRTTHKWNVRASKTILSVYSIGYTVELQKWNPEQIRIAFSLESI